MLLALDIGNSNIEIGLFRMSDKPVGEALASFRIKTRHHMTADEFGVLVKSLVLHGDLSGETFAAVVCSSVVPSLDEVIREMAWKYFKLPVMFVDHRMAAGLLFQYDNPSEVGADRLVNAVAVRELYGGPAVIVDFGTATTFCALSEDEKYLGGVIAPGLASGLETLVEKAAKLPSIDLAVPDRVLGKDTISGMRSGIVYGAIGALEYIIEKLVEELSFSKHRVIATGGFSRLIFSESQMIDHFEPYLTLKGLEIIYYQNLALGLGEF